MVLILPHMNNLSAHTAGNFEKNGEEGLFDSVERGMNHVAMAIINPKSILAEPGINPTSTVLKSCMLPTELWGSAGVDTVLYLQIISPM